VRHETHNPLEELRPRPRRSDLIRAELADATDEQVGSVWASGPGNVWGGVTTTGTVPGTMTYSALNIK